MGSKDYDYDTLKAAGFGNAGFTWGDKVYVPWSSYSFIRLGEYTFDLKKLDAPFFSGIIRDHYIYAYNVDGQNVISRFDLDSDTVSTISTPGYTIYDMSIKGGNII